jgi:hypothetical protein
MDYVEGPISSDHLDQLFGQLATLPMLTYAVSSLTYPPHIMPYINNPAHISAFSTSLGNATLPVYDMTAWKLCAHTYSIPPYKIMP